MIFTLRKVCPKDHIAVGMVYDLNETTHEMALQALKAGYEHLGGGDRCGVCGTLEFSYRSAPAESPTQAGAEVALASEISSQSRAVARERMLRSSRN